MTPESRRKICHHLRNAITEIEHMETPDDAIILAVIDAQDLALEALSRDRLPAFMSRRALPHIHRAGPASSVHHGQVSTVHPALGSGSNGSGPRC